MVVGTRTYVRPRKKQRPTWRKWLLIGICAVAGITVLYHFYIVAQLFRYKSKNPEVSSLMEQRMSEAKSRGETPKKVQTWVPFERISPSLIRAVLAGEDSRFFDHEGFDWEEIQKAMEKDWEEGKFSRGASTISQQLAKNLFLSTSKNPVRKLHEALITWEMEKIMTKRRILEIYLNIIEWGDGIYGAEAASRNYFNTSAASLNGDQAAFLSAIIPSPNGAFAPAKHRGRVERRKNLIERLMRHVVIPKEMN